MRPKGNIARWVWAGIFLLSLMPLIDLMHSGLPVTHDGQDHVVRIANFYRSLSEGNIVPRWAANLNWGYGHPILMFLYPLPSYSASLFHFAGFSFVDSMKLVFAVSYVASMLVMYLWVKSAWGKTAGVIAAFLYGFAPYRFVDLYVRGAIGEHVAFLFPPLICYGLLKLSRSRRLLHVGSLAVVSFGSASLILSHNALSLLFLPILSLYALYLAAYESKRKIAFLTTAILSVGLGFLFSAFFWIPAFFEGKYTLRDIVTAGSYIGRFVPWQDFLYSPWSYGNSPQLSKWLGIGPIIGLAASLFVFQKGKAWNIYKVMLAACYALLAGTIFLMTEWSSHIWAALPLLQKFQFPWRLLSVTTFVLPIAGALSITAVPYAYRRLMVVVLAGISIISTQPMWHAMEYKQYPKEYFTGIYHGTTDTGESAPIWSVRFMEHEPDKLISVIDGDAQLSVGARSSTHHAYTTTASFSAQLVENTLYFPGWYVLVDGMPVSIEFQNPAYRGLMTFSVPPGVHRIDVVFRDTKLRMISNAISFASSALFLAVLGTMPVWQKQRKRR